MVFPLQRAAKLAARPAPQKGGDEGINSFNLSTVVPGEP
jgi:hypothetical protein